MLTRIDKIQVARFLLEKRYGPLVGMYSGPIVWTNDPDEALAQLIIVINATSKGELSRDRATIEIAARVLGSTGYLKGKRYPLAWANDVQLASGNLAPSALSRGIGESLGMLKWVYATAGSVGPTDLDCVAIADELDKVTDAESVGNAWLSANTKWAKPAFAILAASSVKHIGIYRIMDAIDTGKLTPQVVEQMSSSSLPFAGDELKFIEQIFT